MEYNNTNSWWGELIYNNFESALTHFISPGGDLWFVVAASSNIWNILYVVSDTNNLLSYSHHSKPYIMDIYVMYKVLWNILLLGYLHGKHSEPGELEFFSLGPFYQAESISGIEISPLSCWSQHSPGSRWSPWSPWLPWLYVALLDMFVCPSKYGDHWT